MLYFCFRCAVGAPAINNSFFCYMINNFTYAVPTKILFGKGAIARISKEIPSGAKVMVVYGGGSIHKNGVYAQVMEALKGFEVCEFAGIEPNPHYETCMRAVAQIKEQGVGYLLAVGGGSVIDATKLIALAVHADYDAWEVLTKNRYPSEAMPFGTVLTLPATGSEMNASSVITKAATQEKLAFNSPLVFPRFSVLDPQVTYTLPKRQISNGVVDTFVHVCEQYLTYPIGAKIQDSFAESILKVLCDDGPKALVDPENYDVRANLMWASTWALNGWIAKGVPEDWATHMIGHEITALHGLDHGQTLAVVLPGVMRVMKSEKLQKILQMGQQVFGITAGTDDERAEATIEAVDAFFRQMGIGTHLADYGLDAAMIEPIAKRFEDRGWKLGENQTITPDKVREILTQRL